MRGVMAVRAHAGSGVLMKRLEKGQGVGSLTLGTFFFVYLAVAPLDVHVQANYLQAGA